MSFTARMDIARTHEQWVLAQLQQRGWYAEPFGQALFSQELRTRLAACQTIAGRKAPMRWIPDIVAIRDMSVVLVDAKAGTSWRRTNNHAIEQDALVAALGWGHALTVPVWFIFSDGRGASARDLAFSKSRREPPFMGDGSGTQFWVWPRSEMQQVFPDPTEQEDT